MNSPLRRVLESLRACNCDPRPRGDYRWAARCPAHEDKNPSLSVGVGGGGRVLLHCFSGCSIESITSALGLKPADLFPEPARRNGHAARTPAMVRPAPQPAATTDTAPATPEANGAEPPVPEGLRPDVWRRVARIENGCWAIDERDASGAVIGVSYRRADGSKSCKPGSRRGLIYEPPLPDDAGTAENRPVLVAEGATDTAALLRLGFVAVGAPMAGACGPELAALLKGRHVAIVADADAPGRRGAAALARHLAGVCPTVRIVEPLAGVRDVRESLINGATREDYEALIRDAKPWRPEPEVEPSGSPVLVRATDVQPQRVEWVWPTRIPRGALAVLVGRPGEGKSLVALYVAAMVSRGGVWADPDGGRSPEGSVLLCLAEDDPARVVVPRLAVCDADLSRVHLLTGVVGYSGAGVRDDRPLTFLDVDAIEAAMDRIGGVVLIVIDPIGGYLPIGVDSNSDVEVRAALRGLADMAARRGVGVLLVGHTRKAAVQHADDALLGSRAYSAVVRQVLHLVRDPHDPDGGRKLLLGGKSNLSAPPDGLALRVVPRPGPVGPVPAIEWLGPVAGVSADHVVRLLSSPGGSEARSEVDDAAEWLRDYLAEGPRPSREVLAAAREAGYSARTLARARAVVGVRARKGGFDGAWVLELPQHRSAEECQPPQECQHAEVGILRENPGSYSKDANFEGVASFEEGWHSSCPPPLVPLPAGLEGPPAPAWRYRDPNDAPADDRPRGRFRLDSGPGFDCWADGTPIPEAPPPGT